MYIYIDLCEAFNCEMCGACCRNDWQVTLDEASYHRNAALFNTTGKNAEFQKAFVPIVGTGGLGEYAYIAKQANGGCWFLEDTNLCRLHAELGHDHLDNVCQIFPRYPMDTARGVELTLSFSCPAVLSMVSRRTEPLKVIRSERQPMPMKLDDYVVQVYPKQQPVYNPLRYYFELEHHFIDIVQCRSISLEERLQFLEDTVSIISNLRADDTLGQELNRIFQGNYELLDSKGAQEQLECKTADILLEHFFVNFIFKKPFYIYGLQRMRRLLQTIWQQVERARSCVEDPVMDMECTRADIMKLEFQYSHNRRLFGAGLTADM